MVHIKNVVLAKGKTKIIIKEKIENLLFEYLHVANIIKVTHKFQTLMKDWYFLKSYINYFGHIIFYKW